jgi:general secretion pathway protein E
MITSESELPDGALLTSDRGPFRLEEHLREGIAVISVAKSKSKECWVVGSQKMFSTIHFLQVLQTIQKSDYKVVKKDKIDEQVLKLVYERDSVMHSNVSEQRDDSKIIAYFEEMVADALREEVSDIHIEKRAHSAIIKMRKHGEMLEYRELSHTHAYDLCSVIYNVLAENRDIVFNALEYQAAAVNRVVEGVEVKLRYQSLPVYPDGFDVVLRVLPIGKNEEYVPLEKLGYAPSQISALMDVVSKPVGTLVIAGTTGSGKSTTLKNLLMYVHSERGYKDKIYTVEDPPEYKIPRVSQIPVIRRKTDDYSKKSPFEDPIAACMRADPDILMIGEVRDRATGDLLKKAVQSGHQVLTTVHSASALAIIERFIDFGISQSVLGSQEFISGLCYQKLVPLICPHCSIDLQEVVTRANAKESDIMLFERIMRVCDLAKDSIRVRGSGCEKCGSIGVIGRTVCAEIIMPDLELLQFFRDGNSVEAHKHWRSNSDHDQYSWDMTGKSAMEHAMLKLRKGMVSPHDVESAFGLITPLALGMEIGK